MRRRYMLARLAGLYAGAALVALPGSVLILVGIERRVLAVQAGWSVALVAALLAVLAVAFVIVYAGHERK